MAILLSNEYWLLSGSRAPGDLPSPSGFDKACAGALGVRFRGHDKVGLI